MKAASKYASLGWVVIPLHDVASGNCSCNKLDCKSPGKHPRVNDWQKLSDNSQLAVWEKRYPVANVGIVTGRVSGFFVLDIDGVAGASSLEAWVEEFGELPETAQARTGSGGTHYLFKIPDFDVSNTASKLAPGIDVRGDGGQIVVAPSVSGKGRYSWVTSPSHISEAPEWLLEKMRPRQAPRVVEAVVMPTTQQTIDRARRALQKHGPAIEGEGGDTHTFQAAAILRKDFALDEGDAWMLLKEWNATCVPPWSDAGLREKLDNGAKHGKAPVGNKLALSTVEQVEHILDLRNEIGKEAVLEKLRTLEFSGEDYELVSTKIAQCLKLKKEKLQLKVKHRDLKPNEVLVDIHANITAGNVVKILYPHAFSRGRNICEVEKTQWGSRIRQLGPNGIAEFMGRHIQFYVIKKEELVSTKIPFDVAQNISERDNQDLRPLESVVTSPIFLSDGSVLQEPGYNEVARVFMDPDVFVEVKPHPTIEDAKEAISEFKDLLCDVRFKDRCDFSSWMAALLSPLSKSAMNNAPTPLVCISASTPGAGKTLMAALINRIVTGKALEAKQYSGNNEERRKALTTYIMNAKPICCFDNVEGEIGDAALFSMLTSEVWEDRLLGKSESYTGPIVPTWIATGNNLLPHGDNWRRTLFVILDVKEEHPEKRTGFKYSDIEAHVTKKRAKYLGAALTILRAYHCAGRPDVGLSDLGSFPVWSRLVRSALVWAGEVDPVETQEREAKLNNRTTTAGIELWMKAVEMSDGTIESIKNEANALQAREALGLRYDLTLKSTDRYVREQVGKVHNLKKIAQTEEGYEVVHVNS